MNPALRHVGARQLRGKASARVSAGYHKIELEDVKRMHKLADGLTAVPNYEVGKDRQLGDFSQRISKGRARKPGFEGIRDAGLGAKLFKHGSSQPSRTAIDVR